MSLSIKLIQKRDGRIVKFDKSKIEKAIQKAFTATNTGSKKAARDLTQQVVKILEDKIKSSKDRKTPTVEEVQDIVEKVLIDNDYATTAKAYILYREKHKEIRETREVHKKALGLIDDYLNKADWEIKENSNMSYSLQGLNNYITQYISREYWLEKIYSPEVKKAALSGDFHIHDLQTLAPYCCGWDLYDLLIKGFGGVTGKVESRPAKHFSAILGQIVNFFYTLQGEAAGAQAFSNFDTLLAPFIYYDNLSYREVKQALQEFVYNCNVPTRVGFQTPFTNLSFDLTVPSFYKDQPVIIGGKTQDKTYKEFQEQMDLLNKVFAEIMEEGDAKGRPFTFPIPTYSITKNFDWDNETLTPIWAMTAKYGIPYFSNFVNSDLNPEDVRSMCCHLRLDNKELYKRGGGLFGSAPLTGSIGVVTINLPRIGYLSKTKKEFFERLSHLMDLAKESLETKRKVLEKFIEIGLYPYSRHYLSSAKKMRDQYFGNHFSTIGVIGGNEACLNFKSIKDTIGSKAGKEFMEEVLDFIRNRLVEYQEETGNLYNLEASPAEGTSYSLAKIDKEKFPDIITAGEKRPYYTNSTQLPVNFTDDLFEALELQDDLQSKYTGGTVFHTFLGESLYDANQAKKLVHAIVQKFHLPYFTITPTFSICPVHGYIPGEHYYCPKCVVKQPCEVYSRVVGYLRPVSQWNAGKQEEFEERKVFETQGQSKPQVSNRKNSLKIKN